MAISIIRDDIRSADGQDSSGKQTFTRSMSFSYDPAVDTVVDLMQSNFFPQVGSVHPTYTQWTLDSVSAVNVVQGPDGRDEMWITCKYTRGGRSGGFSNKDKDVPPWKLGPQNFSSTMETEQVPVLEVYSIEEKKWKPYVNTAGCRIVRMKNEYIRVISFSMNYQYTGRLHLKNATERINDDAVKVCSVDIPAKCGMLMPMTSNVHTVYENDGKTVKWKYETINITIKVRRKTWKIEDLNVGRLALFKNEQGEITLSPIFQYTPWKSPNNLEQNALVKPKFGSISDVMLAQKTYEKAGGKGKIPFSQFDEDLPLDQFGDLYYEAIENPGTEYLRIGGYEIKPESWNRFDLPKEI